MLFFFHNCNFRRLIYYSIFSLEFFKNSGSILQMTWPTDSYTLYFIHSLIDTLDFNDNGYSENYLTHSLFCEWIEWFFNGNGTSRWKSFWNRISNQTIFSYFIRYWNVEPSVFWETWMFSFDKSRWLWISFGIPFWILVGNLTKAGVL